MKTDAPLFFDFLKEVNNAAGHEQKLAIVGHPDGTIEELVQGLKELGITAEPQVIYSRGSGSNSSEKWSVNNAEGSKPTGTPVTAKDMAEIKDYITKVLGPKVKLSIAKNLGGNSASWQRVNGDAVIRIAANAANPMSKAHHEAMHEFFQRMMDDHPEAAEVLRKAANNPLVVRQIS